MLLIHDLNADDSKEIIPLLPSNSKILSKESDNIKGCLGCFNCWTKTPGKCIINDSYTEMPKYILEEKTFIIITQIKYGCYTSYVKNVIDRSIGILLPFFQNVNGELHHLPRYDNSNLKFIVIGYGSDVTSMEEQTFKALVKGNAINLCIPNHECYVIKDISNTKEIIRNL
ncbi:flavodoxin family protein [Clostridium sp. YIM B02555]|uniref:flavodoxin family protein n=1 Tax=Clostridium sp. YIM B02555 TaxID=2911968 RepID=UPI001EEEAEC4|nr:flavodoxin family protein [Clostridium sp. YIM B02555]